MQHIQSPLQAQIVQWLVAPGAHVAAGDVLVILEAMKMEHEIRATQAGFVGDLYFQAGESVANGDVLGVLMPSVKDNPRPKDRAASATTAHPSTDHAASTAFANLTSTSTSTI